MSNICVLPTLTETKSEIRNVSEVDRTHGLK